MKKRKTIKKAPNRTKKARKVSKKIVLRAKKIFPKIEIEPAGKPIGKVTHFFGDIKVAVVKFSVPVASGKTIRFKGATTDFAQKVASMQHNHKPLTRAPKGKQIGLKVRSKTRVGDRVYWDKK